MLSEELAYILNNSESRVLITSAARLYVARMALQSYPRIKACLVVDCDTTELTQHAVADTRIVSYLAVVAGLPCTLIEDEYRGAPMLYSSGTTGRPKGILRELPEVPPAQELPLMGFLNGLWRYRTDMIYLSPAPLYHSAPQAAVSLAVNIGGTVIIMERFDPERYLQLVERYQVTHSQLVPTMFSRMLKLPQATRERYDWSSLEIAIHSAAPCPVQVKQQMIAWWGPIVHEYYGATEGLGFIACDSA